MNEDVPYQRELSISSERTLDNLETIPSSQVSPLHSPPTVTHQSAGRMDDHHLEEEYRAGSSRPPHHGRFSPSIPMDHYDTRGHDSRSPDVSRSMEQPIPRTKVSWKSPTILEMSPESGHPQTSQFTFEYGAAQSPEKGARDMPKVVVGSDSSPVRRLKKKDDNQRSGAPPAPRVERELSDAYLDSQIRTPRYNLGRHNTYDEMLTSMNVDDPFQGNYQPSGKSPRLESKIPVQKSKKRDKNEKSRSSSNERDRREKAETFPMDNVSSKRKSKKRKKRKGDDSSESTATFSYENRGYDRTPLKPKSVEADGDSVKSNGTYTMGEKQKPTIQTAPVLHRAPHKIKSILKDHKEGLGERDEINREGLAKFVQNSRIMQRECKRYVANQKSPEHHCYCGRDRYWHEDKGQIVPEMSEFQDRKEIWHHHTHTGAFPTDSFGTVQFTGFGQESIDSPYMRMCPSTSLETMWHLLADHWNLPIPKLLISVTGGAQRFDLNPRLKTVFKRGLINAATTTGAWIITGGTATGVMQFVGEAARDHMITQGAQETPVVALGIATWGCIANREALDGDGDEGLFPAHYCLEDVSEIKGKDVPLDHNHTHFILVDDGTEGKFGGEIEFRTKFENYVSEKVETGVAESQSVNVPVVMLVVEGGVNTMKTVWQAVQQNIPVLCLNGSGRAADFISIGYELSKNLMNEDKSKFPGSFDEDMVEIAREKFKWRATDNVDKKVQECLKQLRDTLENRKLVNVFNLCEADNKDIDRAILYALLKANKTNAEAQLSLALAWNRCDIARHEIFTQDNRQYWKNIPLYDAMFTALVQDRVDFVQLFMENGVNLKKFLSIETLWNLYGNALQDTSDNMTPLLHNMMMYLKQSWAAYLCCHPTENRASTPDLLFTVGKLLVHLMGDENMNPYVGEKYIVKSRRVEMKWLPGNHKSDGLSSTLSKSYSDKSISPRVAKNTDNNKKFYKRKRQEYDFNKLVERELFYWAILLNRRELAKIFWRAGQDQLGSALTACSLLKALASVADDEEELELSQDLYDHANLYEDMAYGVLSECYRKDKRRAHQLLVRRLENFGRNTLFNLADSNTLMKFMGHTCCQTKLNLIWKGRMALYTQTWKICLSLVFPFCIPSIKFTTNEGMDFQDDDYDDLDDGEELPQKPKDEVHVINNKVMPNTEPNQPHFEDELFVRSNTRRKKKGRRKLYKVQMFSDIRTNSIGVFSAFHYFYTAPVSVFIGNTLGYLVFLGLFTFFLLTDFYPSAPSVYEYLIWGWTITMFLEEIRQVVSNDKRSLWYKVQNWFGSMWNKFDLLMYVIFILSVILRFVLTGERFVYARILYSITLGMYYMRFMQTFFAEKNIGPKVIMIRNMLVDLMFFLGIFIVFMLSFGVMYQANLFPNSPPNWRLLKSVLYIPYWQMYGELFLEDMEGEHPDSCTSDENVWRPAGGEGRCPEQNALVPVLAAVYLVLTNILLVNLLIAMFSYTFQMVQDKSEQVWRFYRYSLVHEYYDRPMFCPPFIFFNHVYRLVLWIVRNSCTKRKYHNEFKLVLDEKDNNQLMMFVRAAAENYLNISNKAEREELGNKVSATASRIDKVIEELDSIKESVKMSKSATSGLDDTIKADGTDSVVPLSARRQSTMNIPPVLQEHLDDLREQVVQNSLQTSQMMQMIQTILLQQRSRPSHLEIHDITQDDHNQSEL